jgi:choline dehydrogenase-like flavoprotein
VAGGGLTGLVVGTRLSEDSKSALQLTLPHCGLPNIILASVLIVEIGDFDDTWDTAVPFLATIFRQDLMFRQPTTPMRFLNNRTSRVILGRAVGGGTVVNGMAITRGQK